MVRDQALEIVELRKAVNMSAGIIVNTNTTSEETLSVLTNSITAHNELLASIQMTLANDATRQLDRSQEMSSLLSSLHSTTDSKITDTIVRVTRLTDDYRSLTLNYSKLTDKLTQ